MRSAEKVHKDRILELEAFIKSLQSQMVEQQASMQSRLDIQDGKTVSIADQFKALKATYIT